MIEEDAAAPLPLAGPHLPVTEIVLRPADSAGAESRSRLGFTLSEELYDQAVAASGAEELLTVEVQTQPPGKAALPPPAGSPAAEEPPSPRASGKHFSFGDGASPAGSPTATAEARDAEARPDEEAIPRPDDREAAAAPVDEPAVAEILSTSDNNWRDLEAMDFPAVMVEVKQPQPPAQPTKPSTTDAAFEASPDGFAFDLSSWYCCAMEALRDNVRPLDCVHSTDSGSIDTAENEEIYAQRQREAGVLIGDLPTVPEEGELDGCLSDASLEYPLPLSEMTKAAAAVAPTRPAAEERAVRALGGCLSDASVEYPLPLSEVPAALRAAPAGVVPAAPLAAAVEVAPPEQDPLVVTDDVAILEENAEDDTLVTQKEAAPEASIGEAATPPVKVLTPADFKTSDLDPENEAPEPVEDEPIAPVPAEAAVAAAVVASLSAVLKGQDDLVDIESATHDEEEATLQVTSVDVEEAAVPAVETEIVVEENDDKAETAKEQEGMIEQDLEDAEKFESVEVDKVIEPTTEREETDEAKPLELKDEVASDAEDDTSMHTAQEEDVATPNPDVTQAIAAVPSEAEVELNATGPGATPPVASSVSHGEDLPLAPSDELHNKQTRLAGPL